MPRKYLYEVEFNGVDHRCSTFADVCAKLNSQCGFNIVTPNIIYNQINRPAARGRLPGLLINRRIAANT